jgi:hypothetical protein
VLAVIPHQIDPLHPISLCDKLADDFPTVVAAAVVYQDQLKALGTRAKHCFELGREFS